MSKHRFRISLLFMLVWLLSSITVCGAEQQHAIWFFQGDRIPAPPRNPLWRLPQTNIPAEYTDSFAAAFEHILADPRNCEYMEVEVPAGDDAFGGFYRLKTHGWLLPRDDEHSQPFAILWNGLIYPVISIGSTASVDYDVRRLIASHTLQDDIIAIPKQERMRLFEIFVSNSYHHGTICALLLHLGKTTLAEELYHSVKQQNSHSITSDLSEIAIWSLFSRALAAHMYGDDKLALSYAEQYEPLIQDDLEFAETASQLLAEQRRRSRKPSAKNAMDALILDLENVDERQWGQPGGVALGNSKRIQALIAIGDAAVEPLLECLENDTRLTRSVSFPRNFIPYRTIITVREAALAALSGILQHSFYVDDSHDKSNSELAQQIREHYHKYKNMSFEEKWYRVLQDKDEPIAIRLQVAENICRKSNIKKIPGATAWPMFTIDTNDLSPTLTGEALRSKKNPSISELLYQHTVEFLPDESANASTWAIYNAQKMALLCAEWDLPSSLPALQKVSNAIYKELPNYDNISMEYLQLLAPLTIRQVQAGDTAALQPYCEILSTNREHLSEIAWELYLQPLYTFPDDAIVIATAEALFNTHNKRFNNIYIAKSDLFAEFMRLAPYRKHVLSGLRDKTEIIKLQTTIADNNVRFESEFLDGSSVASSMANSSDVTSDPRFPGDQSIQILRTCDVYAKGLSMLKEGGYPAFQNYWSKEDRDQVIEEITAKLSQIE